MRNERDLRQIVDIGEGKVGTDKEENFKDFVDDMGLDPQTRGKLWGLYIEAANESSDLGIIAGVRYSIGEHDEHVKDFIGRLAGVPVPESQSTRDLMRVLRESSGR